jgi:hypothetical protein
MATPSVFWSKNRLFVLGFIRFGKIIYRFTRCTLEVQRFRIKCVRLDVVYSEGLSNKV